MKYDLAYLKKLSILLIEDDKLIQKETAETLKIFFDSVLVASDGVEGLRVYEDSRPNMIISDIKMPTMDGLTFTNQIRLSDYNTPIVLLTSFSDQNTLLKAVNAGIDGYILKPIDLEDMLKTLYKASRKLVSKQEVFTFKNGLIYNMNTKELFKDNELIILGKKEREAVDLFITENRTLSKDEIEAHLWPLESITDSALKNLLSRLRKKVGDDFIVSIKGSGWRLNKG